MTKNTLIVSVLVLLLFALGLGVWFYKGSQRTSQKPPELTPPPATGKIEDLEKSLLLELTDEAALFAEEEKESSAVEGDSLEASGFSDTTDVQY